MNKLLRITIIASTLILSACSSGLATQNQFENTLKDTINSSALEEALSIYNKQANKPERLIIVDYTLPSEKERFYVLNMWKKVLEHKTFVSHAVNSGFRKPYIFSNTPNSKMSSVGEFLTAETYKGKNGLSIRIEGKTKGVNNNARRRFIVIHGSTYAEKSFFDTHGMLGRSEGCFAIPMSVHLDIIPKIGINTPMYVYYSAS